MANGTTTPVSPTGGTDFTQQKKLLDEAAARTRDVQTLSPETKAALDKAAAQLGGKPKPSAPTGAGYSVSRSTQPEGVSLQPVGEALIGQLESQEATLKKQAESTASALEIAGGAAIESAQNIETMQQSLRQEAGSVSDAWGAAAEKADEYVQAARGRVGEVLSKLDTIYQDIKTTNDFAKAHDMQAAVQASIGSMKAEERNIAQVYGTGSKEYQQFQQQKRSALGAIQSNIHASYAKLKSQMDTTYLSTVSDAYARANTAVSYQEQQHVEMLNYMQQNQAAYNLKVAELDATLEQMKTAGMENLANWILETPTFSMDATSTVTAISDLLVTQETLRQAGELSEAEAGYTRSRTPTGKRTTVKASPWLPVTR